MLPAAVSPGADKQLELQSEEFANPGTKSTGAKGQPSPERPSDASAEAKWCPTPPESDRRAGPTLGSETPRIPVPVPGGRRIVGYRDDCRTTKTAAAAYPVRPRAARGVGADAERRARHDRVRLPGCGRHSHTRVNQAFLR